MQPPHQSLADWIRWNTRRQSFTRPGGRHMDVVSLNRELDVQGEKAIVHSALDPVARVVVDVIEAERSSVAGAWQEDAHTVVIDGVDPPLVVDLGQRIAAGVQPVRDRDQPDPMPHVLVDLIFLHIGGLRTSRDRRFDLLGAPSSLTEDITGFVAAVRAAASFFLLDQAPRCFRKFRAVSTTLLSAASVETISCSTLGGGPSSSVGQLGALSLASNYYMYSAVVRLLWRCLSLYRNALRAQRIAQSLYR